MSEPSQNRFTIVIHACGNAMTVQQDGRITRTRASEPGRLWADPMQCRTSGSLSLAHCQETHLVLLESMKLEGRG